MELKQVIDELEQFNKKGEGEIGFNDQEREADKFGYFKDKLPNYLPAKLRLLKKREKETDENKKILLNAARIYTYTLFENTWFGYLIAYADRQENVFTIKNEEGEEKTIEKSYLNHLPSFSSAILHFGTCRDLFSPLLKILVYLKEGKKFENFNQEFLKIKYDWFKTKFKNSPLHFRLMKNLEDFLDKYNFTRTDSINRELKDILEGNNIKELHNFTYDLELLLKNCNLDQKEYPDKGKNFFDLNKFRNTFAHNIRMLWWKNRELWGFSNEDYENMRLGKREFHDVLIGIFKDHRVYEKTIEELAPSQFKHSAKILQETHDTIATFLNETFALILPDEPIA
ncbi:hypothetical protein LDFHOB_08880 [Candidatus Electronema aureum]